MEEKKEDIQQDIDPKDIDKIIADLAKLGYKVEKEETKEEKELRRLEEELARIDPGVEPTDEDLIAEAKIFHPYYQQTALRDALLERVDEIKKNKK